MIGFLIGLLLGGLVGVMFMALFQISRSGKNNKVKEESSIERDHTDD